MSILDDITSTFTERLRFPDPRPLHAVLGAVAGTYFKGRKPVWLLVVGASSSGKTPVLLV
jgi:hypothetical protein